MHTRARSLPTRPILRAVLVVAVLLGVLAATATASDAATNSQHEDRYLTLVNQHRVSQGLPPMQLDYTMSDRSREWSRSMASNQNLSHDPNYAQSTCYPVTGWEACAENVGRGYDLDSLHQAFLDSPGHRANIEGNYNRVGIGVAQDSGGRIWITVRFMRAAPINTTTGLEDNSSTSGSIQDRPATTSPGDTVGVFRDRQFYLRNANSGGNAHDTFAYGTTDDNPLVGDWNGDGRDTIGIRRRNAFYLRNSNSGGNANYTFAYGRASDTVLTGDWNGDGRDTIGIRRGNAFYLRNSNTSGPAEIVFGYGTAADTPVVGDWNGDGRDTIGIRRGNAFYLRNSNSGGNAEIVFGYGTAADTPVVGDWNGDGRDTIGIRRGNAFYLRNSNSGGNAEIVFGYGTAADTPVTGNWNGS